MWFMRSCRLDRKDELVLPLIEPNSARHSALNGILVALIAEVALV